MKIGKTELQSNILLAPLAGFTDIGFRSICKKYHAGLTCTEMISAKGLIYGNDKTEALISVYPNEKPTAIQLFGNDPTVMARAVERVDFDIVDVNMGCPVPKVVRNGEGSALMKTPEVAENVIRAMVKATPSPVTVKCRIGFDRDHINVVDFAKRMEQAGASAITVHGRTREQMYSGKADWDVIGEVARAVSIPVIGNGDIETKEDYQRAMSYGVQGVMIGRGALGRPYVFDELTDTPYTFDPFDTAREHIAVMLNYFNDLYVTNNMKKHLCRYLRGMRNTNAVKERIFAGKSTSELLDTIKYAQEEVGKPRNNGFCPESEK